MILSDNQKAAHFLGWIAYEERSFVQGDGGKSMRIVDKSGRQAPKMEDGGNWCLAMDRITTTDTQIKGCELKFSPATMWDGKLQKNVNISWSFTIDAQGIFRSGFNQISCSGSSPEQAVTKALATLYSEVFEA